MWTEEEIATMDPKLQEGARAILAERLAFKYSEEDLRFHELRDSDPAAFCREILRRDSEHFDKWIRPQRDALLRQQRQKEEDAAAARALECSRRAPDCSDEQAVKRQRVLAPPPPDMIPKIDSIAEDGGSRRSVLV
ncbi:hypothetical protein EJB05_32019 [Eragrostis curvula]|uniref:Uncharacterized protein n=1 Tax=Eragrostis curvula TaxID=38414 RepID=A0A5J9UF42_9POAL|nr:hypothetical protein EJB05_32019 [Eragrostis curvula]